MVITLNIGCINIYGWILIGLNVLSIILNIVYQGKDKDPDKWGTRSYWLVTMMFFPILILALS